MLLAVALTVVLRRSSEGDLTGALGDEGVAEIGLESHAVPWPQLGAQLLEQVGAEAVALGAHQLYGDNNVFRQKWKTGGKITRKHFGDNQAKVGVVVLRFELGARTSARIGGGF